MMQEILLGTRNGGIRGFVERAGVYNKDVNVFHNVPFAQPPVGKLRFLKPKPITQWSGIRDGIKRGKIPWQSILTQNEADKCFAYKAGLDRTTNGLSEDCLQSSIYTPSVDKNSKLPVMVWFYGGAFSVGSNDVYDGSILSSMNDVVVVVPNYRVNVFGFLSLGPLSCCPGNAGLFDQLLALKWVKENITDFGGDPNNVTIFGNSAGGTSVGLHINSPCSSGLFHKAITHSGEATMPLLGMFVGNGRHLVESLCEVLEIKMTTDEEILRKLQEIDPERLTRATEYLTLKKRKQFVPTVDYEFVIKKPIPFSKSSEQINKVPHIVGYNDSESLGILGLWSIKGFANGITGAYAKRLNEIFLEQNYPNSDLKTANLELEKHYLESIHPNDSCRFSKYHGELKGDVIFRVPAQLTAQGHSESGMPTYVYIGAYQPQFNHSYEYGPNNVHKPDWVNCDHSDDVAFTFGAPFSSSEFLTRGTKFTQKEMELSKTMMAYFTNFAKTGDPNKACVTDVEWPQYDNKQQMCLKLSTDKLQVIQDNTDKEVKLWSKITKGKLLSKI